MNYESERAERVLMKYSLFQCKRYMTYSFIDGDFPPYMTGLLKELPEYFFLGVWLEFFNLNQTLLTNFA